MKGERILRRAKEGKSQKLIFNAGRRTPEEVQKEFFDPRTSFAKRKGILEGIAFHLNRLCEIRNPDLETRKRLVDFQDLQQSLTKALRSEANSTRKEQTKPSSPSLKTVQPSDRAPQAVRQSRHLFSNEDQFSASQPDSEICDVIIGVDFGTACTKVVVRTPYHGNHAYLVPFGTFSHSSSKYLLPTHISLQDNYYLLPMTGQAASDGDLKMRLIDSLRDPDGRGDLENAIAYMALIFRYVRTWFMKEHQNAFKDYHLEWQVNVGIPSAAANDDDLAQLYRQAIGTAWMFSLEPGDTTHPALRAIRQRVYDNAEEKGGVYEFIDVFPEVAAEVAGYTQSEYRKEGLHLMIDIGAGTLDVCGFNVYRHNGENRLPLFSTSVERRGVRELHHSRRAAVIDAIRKSHDGLMPDPASPLESDPLTYLPEREKCTKAIKLSEQGFMDGCLQQVRMVIQHLKGSMDPKSEAWQCTLPIFLCGGGRNIPYYQKLYTNLSSWLKKNHGSSGARLEKLPIPKFLLGDIQEADYHRFAVAWGLSYPAVDIDKVMTNISPVNESRKEKATSWWMQTPDYLLADD